MLRANDQRVLSDLLAQRVPGLRLRKEGGAEYAVSARAGTLGNGGALAGPGEQGRCYLDVFVDGASVYKYTPADPTGMFAPPDLAKLGVRDYMGVEVYVGIGTVPARYARHENQCGVMLLWTRSR